MAAMSGKTEWVKRLLAHKENMMIPVPKKVLFCYKYWQSSYTEMLKTISEITFYQGMLNDLVQSKYFDPNVPSLIVFDDLMRTVRNDDTAADLITEGAHHHNIIVVFITQNLFFQGKHSSTISVNTHYFILLKNHGIYSKYEYLDNKFIQESPIPFLKPTMRPHGYLVVDLYTTTPDSCKLRTNIFSGENNQFYPNDIFHTISFIVKLFKKKNYMESAELQAMHNSKKQMDTLMGRHDLPSEIKEQEIGKAQDQYLLFRNRLKSDQSVKTKGILEPKIYPYQSQPSLFLTI